jgi:Domain of unknown function (DUF4345)
MNTWLRHTIWFSRIVLLAATLLFTTIALRNLFDPVGAAAPHEITLGTAAGVTVARVGFGGFPLGFAIILLMCLTAERRLLAGLGFLVVLMIVVTATRVLGLVLDGPASFTLRVLKPEVALIVASTAAFFLERRRRQLAKDDEPSSAHPGALQERSQQ